MKGAARKFLRLFSRQNLLAVLSCLFAVTIVFAWIAYYAHGRDLASFIFSKDRYRIRLEGNSAALLGPPQEWPLTDAAQSEYWAQRLTNNEIIWQLSYRRTINDTIAVVSGSRNVVCYDKEPYKAFKLNKMALTKPFLRNLEDPDRFGAAHLLLLYNHWPPYRNTTEQRSGHVLVCEGGLFIGLYPIPPMVQPRGTRGTPIAVEVTCRGPEQLWVDPSQLERIRQYWHELLDVRVFSVPYPVLLGVCLIAPSLRCASLLRKHHRLRAGRCTNCGYDLRESRERCPECGRSSARALGRG